MPANRPRPSIADLERVATERGVDISKDLDAIRRAVERMKTKISETPVRPGAPRASTKI